MPIYAKSSGYNGKWTQWSKSGYVQKPPPYVRPLEYSYSFATQKVSDSKYEVTYPPPNWAAGIVSPSDDPYVSAQARAYAAAYDRLISSIRGGTTASVATTVAERRESFEMIAKRAVQLRSAYSNIRRGNVQGFLKDLGYTKKQKKSDKSRIWARRGKRGLQSYYDHSGVLRSEAAFKKGLKTPSQLWLEYWFGWAPLLNDVYSAVVVSSDKLPSTSLRSVFRGTGFGQANYSSISSSKTSFTEETRDCRYLAACIATVKESNPNLALANRLGIVNPASVAWELVPFSWLVDWFIPVGRYLESYTDTVGFDLSNVQTAKLNVGSYTSMQVIGLNDPDNFRVVSGSGSAVLNTRRMDALTRPSLTSRKGTGISSLTRAATSVAILAGFLKRP